MSAKVLVELDAVSLDYGTGDRAVHAVSAVTGLVAAGASIAITGPSGSGKSSLLHLIAGLETPTGGRVSWPAFGMSPHADPARAGLVFQAPSLIPSLDVIENIALPLVVSGMSDAQARDRARAALDLLDLGWLGNQVPGTLSGGQAQRAALARILALRPPLMLADEPTGQLDSETGAVVLDLIFRVADEVGAALVVSTHDRTVAARFGAEWTMVAGRLAKPAVAA
jgi:predicted ABC-type transport system involved in lysophospholipase L1 biosynthesis ATPase subunit